MPLPGDQRHRARILLQLGSAQGRRRRSAEQGHWGLARERYRPLATLIGELPIRFLAAVNCVAAGAGFAVALAADLRVASEDAWFSCAFAAIGLAPDAGPSSFLLPPPLRYPVLGQSDSC